MSIIIIMEFQQIIFFSFISIMIIKTLLGVMLSINNSTVQRIIKQLIQCSICNWPKITHIVWMSNLRYLCLFSYSGVQHILCCIFVLFVFVLCLLYHILPVSLNCQFVLPLRCSLTFIEIISYHGVFAYFLGVFHACS